MSSTCLLYTSDVYKRQRLARAKGVSENNIALRHIFRNAMVPLVQYIPSEMCIRDRALTEPLYC